MSNAHEPSDYGAVFHILGAPAVRARVAQYITGGEIDWRGLLGESRRMSGGEALLVRIAHDLWQGGNSVAVWELPRRLDASSFERVVEALTVARTGSLPPRPAGIGRAPVRLMRVA